MIDELIDWQNAAFRVDWFRNEIALKSSISELGKMSADDPLHPRPLCQGYAERNVSNFGICVALAAQNVSQNRKRSSNNINMQFPCWQQATFNSIKHKRGFWLVEWMEMGKWMGFGAGGWIYALHRLLAICIWKVIAAAVAAAAVAVVAVCLSNSKNHFAHQMSN